MIINKQLQHSWRTFSRHKCKQPCIPLDTNKVSMHPGSSRRICRQLGAKQCTQAVWDEESSVSVADLRSQLNAALEVEDYKTAASLRDSIQLKMVDSKLAVEDVNTKFYDAFRNGDMKGMESTWGHGEHVQVIHPGGECIAGRDMVIESWRKVLANIRPRAFMIDLEDVRIYASDNTAFVTCVEVINADENKGRICATNIFEKQDGQWVIVMHHGSIAPAFRAKIRSKSV